MSDYQSPFTAEFETQIRALIRDEIEREGNAPTYIAAYEHRGYGWCANHGFWNGPLSCPQCEHAPRSQAQI